MRINSHTIETWADVQYAVREEDFCFLHFWERREQLIAVAQSPYFFSNDTELGFSAVTKQLVFNYVAGQWMREEANPTSVFALKEQENGFLFLVKQFVDEDRLTTICSVVINEYKLPQMYHFLRSVNSEDGKVSAEKDRLLAVSGLLLLLSDGADARLRANDKWISDNEQDIRFAMGLASVARNDDFVISVYNSSKTLSALDNPIFPLQCRVIDNKSGNTLVVHLRNEPYVLQPNECMAGIFHDDDCYCLLPNKGKCPISQTALSIRLDRGKHQTYLMATDLTEPIYNVLSFVCGERGYCYVHGNGEVHYDLSHFYRLSERLENLPEEDGQILNVSFLSDNQYRIITTKQIKIIDL